MKALVSDEQVAREFQSGGQRAFDELVARYKTRLYQWIVRYIGDPQRAEELTQETFIRVYRHLAQFDTQRSFRTWIYRIAVNLAKNELRDRSRSPFDSRDLHRGADDDAPPLEPRASIYSNPQTQAEESEIRQQVMQAVAALPPKFRDVFLLRELEGMSYEEIATVLNRPVGTIRSRVNRARERFRKLLEPYLSP